MSHLILTGVIRGNVSTLCNFTVSVNGGPFASPDSLILDKAIFTIPDQPVTVTVRATAVDADKYGTVEGRFQVDAAGNLQSSGAPPELTPPQTIAPSPLRTIAIFVHFTPLVDVTERALDMLRPTGPDFPGLPSAPAPRDMTIRQSFIFTPMPPPALAPRTLTDHTFISDRSMIGAALRAVSRTSAPQGTITIFEWRGVKAPRLFAVFWPTAVPVGPGAGRTPFLLYFHPTAGQNTAEFFTDPRDRRDPATGDTYPWGFDYQFFGFWRYLNYDRDPLKRAPGCKGLPHQIEASGKNVVLVLPLNRAAKVTCDETASLNDAAFVQELLEELQAYAFRRGGNYQPPGIGHLAMASFSSGHTLLSCFLGNQSNHQHPLYLDVLREIYLFDPHADEATKTLKPVLQAALWASRGQAATKVVRLYTQNRASQLAPVLAGLGLPRLPAPVHDERPFEAALPGNARRSIIYLPREAWAALATELQGSVVYEKSGRVHQVISALMLTDALRRSDFLGPRLRLHVKILSTPPLIPISQMIANARALYAAHGTEVIEASRELVTTLGGTDLGRFQSLFVGEARTGEPTAELTELHDGLRARGGDQGAELAPTDVVVAFVRDLVPASRGCASHPLERPGVVLSASAAGEWTLAHELGHLLGLQHVVDPGRLMLASTTAIANPPPTLTADDVATLSASPLLQV